MKKLITLLICVVIGISVVGISNAQVPFTYSTTLYQRGNDTAYGGATTGFFLKPTSFPHAPSGATKLYIYQISILDLNTTNNTVTIYLNSTTYAQATIGSKEQQILGSVTFLTDTTWVVGAHVSRGNPVVGVENKGAAYLGDAGAEFDCTQRNGQPIKVDALGFYITTSGVARHFTAEIKYYVEH